jgi:hypothetical protein
VSGRTSIASPGPEALVVGQGGTGLFDVPGDPQRPVHLHLVLETLLDGIAARLPIS